MQRLEYHNRIAQIVTVRDILDVGILAPIGGVFANRIRLQEGEVYQQERNEEDFGRKANPLVASHGSAFAETY